MSDSLSIQTLDAIFEALGNKHRREIVYRLGLQPQSISHLASFQNLSLPAIHKHIVILERSGLVQRRKLGQTNFIALRRKSFYELHQWLQQFHIYWGADDESLKNYQSYLEGGEKK